MVNSEDAAALPAVPASAGALIFDRKGRLLILKPTYKSGWTIPGGVMEADGESPWEACQREVREECGLTVRSARLACVDFRRPRPGRPGGIRYLFDCGRMDDDALGTIVLQAEELSEFRFAKLGKAFPKDESFYRHAEGNSDAHLLTSLVGTSVMIPIENGKLVLGRWQAVYLCEFDGPRTRTLHVQAL